jgi:hypothetical protein
MTDEEPDEFDELPPVADDDATRQRDEHDLYLKAVNNSVRRRILELVTLEHRDVDELTQLLEGEGLVAPGGSIAFHLDLLAKAECICMTKDEDTGQEHIDVTQKGKIVDHFY